MKIAGKTLVVGISESVERQILAGAIAVGQRLPSIRQFAAMHHCSVNTVVGAFELLATKGLIKPKRGSGYYVIGAPATRPPDDETRSLDRAMDTVWLMREQVKRSHTTLPVGEGFPPVAWLEDSKLYRYQKHLDRVDRDSMYRYGDRYGYPPLRQHLVQRLAHLGIAAGMNQIVLTHGANLALNAIIYYFVKAGDSVLVDDPGYYPLFGKLRLHGANIVGVPRQSDGPDVDALENCLRKGKFKLFFTQSVGHNPTGSDLSPDKARRILELAEKYKLIIVESDPFADFHAASSTRMAALDQLARTIYIGTFSKSLSPALRVGFLACSADLASDLADVKLLMHVSTSEYTERLIDAMLSDGQYLRHTARLRERVSAANQAAHELFLSYGAEFFCRSPHSLYVWAALPSVLDSREFARAMLARDIGLAPGAIFSVKDSAPSRWCRFNVGYVSDARFVQAVSAELKQAQEVQTS